MDKKEAIRLLKEENSDFSNTSFDDFRDDIEVASIVVEKDVLGLLYVSEELTNNKKLVLKAVSNYGYALKFAGESLRDDLDVVAAAMTSDCMSF